MRDPVPDPTPPAAPGDDRARDAETLRRIAVALGDDLAARADALERALVASRAEAEALRAELARTRQQLEQASVQLGHAYRSLSWRATGPLRRVAERFPSIARLEPAVLTPYWAATGKLRPRLAARKAAEAVVDSGVLDPDFYLARNPDVAMSGVDPAAHYLEHGAAEGRAPNPQFAADAAVEAHAAAAPPVERVDPLDRWKRLRRPERDRGSVLVVDYQVPTPDRDSGSVRMVALLELLAAMGRTVTFASQRLSAEPDDEARLLRLGVEIVRGDEALRRHLDADGWRHRWVVLSRPSIVDPYLGLVRARAPFAQVIYDTVDLHWIRLERAAALRKDAGLAAEARAARASEACGITCSDLVLAISEAERRVIAAEWPEAKVAVVPNVHRPRPTPRRLADRSGLLFIGGYGHAPNVDAVAWLVRDVLPLVVRELPDVKLRLLGSRVPPEVGALAGPGVEVVGWVADAEPFFDEARVFVAPLRFGAGMNGKIGQAMSLGLPVVTTPVGAEGLSLTAGEDALIAEGAEDLAREIVRLYRDEDLWARLRANALRRIERELSPEAVRPVLERIFAAGGAEGGPA